MVQVNCSKCGSTRFKILKSEEGTGYLCLDCEENKKIDTRTKFSECYTEIIDFLKEWVDIPEPQMKVISIWIIGTYFHKQMSAYPYLFINAMRGSGKTRLLRIISWLQYKGNGELLNNPSEPVLFRTAQERGLIFDEFESQKSKDKQTMREYLNACYKEGGIVYRMEKQKGDDGKEKQVAVGHPLYTPVALANINGIEDVLGDRSITLIIEKSMNPYLVKKIEDFKDNTSLKALKKKLNELHVQLCNVYPLKNVYSEWNEYVRQKYTYNTSIHTIHNSTQLYTQLKYEEMFNKIDETGIFGRNLELFFPLLIISWMLDVEIFLEMLNIVSDMNTSKKEMEYAESKDISLIEFVASKTEYQLNMVFVNELFTEFKMFAGASNDRDEEINITWFGSALRRLKLITLVKRVTKGKMVLLNVPHAQNQLKIFKTDEEVKV